VKVYYEENDKISYDVLRAFIKSNISVEKLVESSYIQCDDLVFISKDTNVKFTNNTLVWESVLEYFYNYVIILYNSNYDYYYLKNALKSTVKLNIDTLILGSSYACFGIEETLMDINAINLSLPSQDLYYANIIARYVCDKNKNIKRILIGTGYYSFYTDLSKTKNETEIRRVSDVYYPLFQDLHNCLILPNSHCQPDISNVYHITKIIDIISEDIFEINNREYFCKGREREKLKLCTWNNAKIEWKDVDVLQKIESGEKRANNHNRNKNNEESYLENINHLNSFVKYCNQRNIVVYMIAFPSTSYYKNYLNPDYNKKYKDALNEIKGEIHLLDFNDLDIFCDDDFNDMDHLNKQGAEKLTLVLNEIISEEVNV